MPHAEIKCQTFVTKETKLSFWLGQVRYKCHIASPLTN